MKDFMGQPIPPEAAASNTTDPVSADLLAALNSSLGYLLNAKIDLETGCTKATAIKTIEGGIAMVRAALAKVPS